MFFMQKLKVIYFIVIILIIIKKKANSWYINSRASFFSYIRYSNATYKAAKPTKP